MISEKELERRRKISEAKKGKPRPDVAERNRSEAMRNAPRVISDEARARMSATRTVHGHGRRRSEGRQGTKTYYVWAAMIQRCTNESCKDYPLYGGRGITVCERWLDFRNFLADMGEKPDGLMIERVDNYRGYEPGNCEWATPVAQGRNKRNNHLLTHEGRTMCLSEWAEETGIPVRALSRRVASGWSVSDAISVPVGGWRS